MPTLTPTFDAVDCRANVITSITASANGDTIRFKSAANGGGDAWNFKGFTEAGVELTVNASGAIEVTKNLTLLLDPGVILQESSVTPFTASGANPNYSRQCLIRFKGASNCGITFGAGSKLLGRRSAHAGDLGEFMCGAKFVGCIGVTITGTGELHFDGFYGDGLWFGSSGYVALGPLASNSGVSVTNVLSSNNHRSGITAEGCVGTFTNVGGTGNDGTSPKSFMVIETDVGTEEAGGIPDTLQLAVDSGSCEGFSNGITVNIANDLTNPILITLKNYRSLQGSGSEVPWGFGFTITGGAVAPAGSILRCANLKSVGLKYAGYKFKWPIDSPMKVVLDQCTAENCSTLNLDKPFDFELTGAPTGGGIRLSNCLNIDKNFDRAATVSLSSGGAATNVTGELQTRAKYWPIRIQRDALLPNLKISRFGRLQFSNSAKSRRGSRRGER